MTTTGLMDMREWMSLLEKGGRAAKLVQHVMKKIPRQFAPVAVATGPMKKVIIRGDAIDQTEFPVPKWLYLERGRYIHTFLGMVTRDSGTRVMNVGIQQTPWCDG
jgi:UbiD family decarboxylase